MVPRNTAYERGSPVVRIRASSARCLGVWLAALIVITLLANWAQHSAAQTTAGAVLLSIDGPIGPATSDYLSRSLNKAVAAESQLIIIRLDTPGGLDSSMRQIVQDVLSSPLPIVTYVFPAGARAASAGTYILYASHVAAMSPGTNLGAATPIQLGAPPRMPSDDQSSPSDEQENNGPGDSEQSEEQSMNDHPDIADKAVNDASAFIRSLAQERGRNVTWAEQAVVNAATLSVDEALQQGVIEFKAADLPDLMRQMNGHEVTVLGTSRTLSTDGLVLESMEPDWRSRLLAIITNPNVAYILMLIGVYGLILEFYNPGMLLPGITGLISLLLALYAFQVLPVNYAGLALFLLGIGLMVAEALAPSFGVLGIGGVIAFVIGSVMLLETDVPGFGVSWPLIVSVAVVSSGLFLFVMTMLMRSRRRAVVTGQEEMIGSEGQVVDWENRAGQIRVHGELWRAQADQTLQPGQRVRVESIDGLVLAVRAVE